MRAPVLHSYRNMTYDELPDPVAGPGEVVLKITLCGICGSDVHRYDNKGPVLSYEGSVATEGLIMGHEYVGTVVEIGAGVTEWKLGDRAIEAMNDPCGGCTFCNRGEEHLCQHHYILESQSGKDVHGRGRVVPGGYGQYVALEAARLMHAPDDFDDQAAASIEASAVGYHAVHQSGMRVGDSVIVFGAGPIGLYTMQFARAAGARRLITVEPVPERAAVAKELGADDVIDPFASDDIVRELIERTGGGADQVFEAAGVPATVQQAFEAARQRGRVTMVGVTLHPARVRPATLAEKELTVRTSLAFIRADIAPIIELFRRGTIQAKPMITDTVPGAETAAAFERLLQPNAEIKILVDPQA